MDTRQLIEAIEHALPIAERHGVDARALHAARERLAAGAFVLMIAGAFKRGKSTLVNALLGAEVLPTGVIPVTNVATTLVFGAEPGLTVVYGDGRREHHPLDRLRDFVAEAGNPANTKGVKHVEVHHPSAWLQHGLRVVDTPGVGSVHAHQTRTAHDALPRLDAAVLVLSADPPVGEAELAYLQEIVPLAGRVFVVMNKIDQLTPTERADALAFTVEVLQRTVDTSLEVFAISARQALAASLADDAAGFEASGLGRLRDRLATFLEQERGEAQRHAIVRALARAATDIQRAIGLERYAIEAPTRTLAGQLDHFKEASAELASEQRAARLVLDAEARELVKGMQIDKERYAEREAPSLLAAYDAEVQEVRAASTMALDAKLEALIRARIQATVEARHAEIDRQLWSKVRALEVAYAKRVDGLVERLHAISSDLFGLPKRPLADETVAVPPPGFTYRWVEHVPTASSLVGRGLAGRLPVGLMRAHLIRRHRERLAWLFDVQLNWLRQDLEQRLAAKMQTFRDQLDDRLAAAIAAVTAALERGVRVRDEGTGVLAARLRQLDRDDAVIASVFITLPAEDQTP